MARTACWYIYVVSAIVVSKPLVAVAGVQHILLPYGVCLPFRNESGRGGALDKINSSERYMSSI